MSNARVQSLFRQAVAARAEQRLASAVALCNQALAIDRRRPSVLDLLAQIVWEMGDSDQSIDLLQQVVKIDPRSPRFRTNLGRGYAREARYGEAMVQYDQALKLEPGHAPAIAAKAHAYARQDRYDRARRTLKPLLDPERAPPAEVGATCLHVLIHEREFDAAVALGRAILAAPHASNDAVRETYFELARAEERTGAFDAALATAHRGNAILAPAYDAARARRRVDALIETFAPPRLVALPRPRAPSSAHIFVFGMPRSGTTLVERILHAHPAVHGIGESGILHTLTITMADRIGSSFPYPACVLDLTKEHVEALATWYGEQAARGAPNVERIVDKDLGNTNRLGLISVLLPAAKLVHCRRTPVDTCLSCFMEPLTPASHPYATDLRHLGQHYRQYERLMQHWHDILDVPILDVQYEELVDDQAGVSRQIVEFCGLPWDDACLRYYEVKRTDRTLSFDQVRRPIYGSSVARAERFGSLLDPLREALAQDP